MDILKDLDHADTKTVDYFINSKVDDLIERSVIEGKKRRQIEDKVADDSSDPSTHAGIEYLSQFADFTSFPKYTGRGIQDAAPDFAGSSLTMWFSEVVPDEVETFIKQIIDDGFKKDGPDYIKVVNGKKHIMSISTSGDRLRIYYKLGD